MKYSKELKVGLSLIGSLLIFIFGFRYFENLPLFRGTYTVHTSFDNAGGLKSGNDVRINGVNVGAIDEVTLDVETNNVLVQFHVRDDIHIPQGSYTKLGGIAALSSIFLEILLVTDGDDMVPDDGFIPSQRGLDLLADLTEKAPQLIDQVDDVLEATATTITEVSTLLGDSDSPLGQTLTMFSQTAATLDQLLREEKEHLSGILSNLENISNDVHRFTEENGDSLDLLLNNVNQVLSQLEDNLDAIETSTVNLESILKKIDRGEGTLGMMVNDPSVYLRLDSTLTQLNRILVHFEEDPARYLRELKLIDIL